MLFAPRASSPLSPPAPPPTLPTLACTAFGWRFCLLVCLALCLLAPAWPLLGESSDQRFLAGLRARRLFALAERYARERLGDESLTETARADLTIELAATYARHAAFLPAAERAPLWNAAHDVVATFERRQPPSPRLVLVQLQDALTWRLRGDVAREEARLSAAGDDLLADARQSLVEASRRLETLRETVARLLRERHRDGPPRGEELSAGELASLEQHVRLELARTLRGQAQCYAADSPDWVHALQQAVRQLAPVADVATPNELVWQARLDEGICHRLLGDRAAAAKRLGEVAQGEAPAELLLAAQGELLRLEVGAGRIAEALQLLSRPRTLGGVASAELDLAILETYVAAWLAADKAQDAPAAARWQQLAGETAVSIEQLHGAYWARRAQRALGRAAADSGAVANLEVLERAAANAFRLRQYDEALAAYDQATTLAQRQGDIPRALRYGLTAAAIEHSRQRWDQAAQRFRALALAHRTRDEAPAAHWNAVTCAAQASRQSDPPRLDDYLALLEEHVATWPNGPTVDRARWWLGQLRQQQGDLPAAAAAYRAVSPGAAEFPEALDRLIACHEALLARHAGDPAALNAALRLAVEDLNRVVYSAEGGLPERWSPAQRAAALGLARALIRWDQRPERYAAVGGLLSAALRDAADAPAAWLGAARGLLVVALAGTGDRAGAQQLLHEAAQAAPRQLLEIVAGLAALAETSPPAARGELAQLQLGALAVLVPRSAELAEAERTQLRRLGAAALAQGGRRDEALREYGQLTREFPRDGALHEEYARLLSAGTDRASQEQALAQWRFVVERSKPREERWFQAQYGVAAALLALDRKAEARQAIELLMARPPGLGGTPWQAKFAALLERARR